MTSDKFQEISQAAFDTFREKMHEWHLDKPPAWQYLIQLNTDLPFDDKLTYTLPIDMLRMEDSQDKTRSIILWRILQHETDIETLKKIASILDENLQTLTEA